MRWYEAIVVHSGGKEATYDYSIVPYRYAVAALHRVRGARVDATPRALRLWGNRRDDRCTHHRARRNNRWRGRYERAHNKRGHETRKHDRARSLGWRDDCRDDRCNHRRCRDHGRRSRQWHGSGRHDDDGSRR